ncbi:hypothetical protein TWF696_005224 [Orbilia brochopaga]|uniref:Purine permease n=1 Tax=Orbilia brochopaga TaxID=3140254 RepID=A0AAV9V3D3_9PEZI
MSAQEHAHEGPDTIVPGSNPPKASILTRFRRNFFTKEGLVGDYDYAFLFRPNIPFLRKARKSAPFFGLHDPMPILLAMLLGFQHALAMLAGVISPPIIIGGSGQNAANLSPDVQRYLVSTSLIVCGILSAIQITRFHIYRTPYYLGTGLISVVGTSFAIIPVAQGAFTQMYQNGFCPTAEDGSFLPCPKGYGALLGSAMVCALLEILLSFMPPKILQKIFPPIVTGPTVMLIGTSLIGSGFKNWAGGNGPCSSVPPPTEFFALCPNISAPRPLPWGSAEFIGLGFLVFVSIILCERFGSPIMKSCAVIIGLLIGCIVAGACGYFDGSGIKAAPAVSFIWVHTFPLSVYGPIVLPLLAVYLVLMMEAIGDITATCDVSKLDVEGKIYESRIQGGVLADGFNGLLACLATITPMSTFAQNNGVIALTRCANRKAGYFCCFWLIVAGIFAKFAAALVAIPGAVLGGMTTFLFSAVAVSGMRITSTMPFTRRNRFIVTCGLALGFGAEMVNNWFEHVFTYKGGNSGKRGFFDAITLVCSTGFALCAFVTLILNLILPDEDEDAEETQSVIALQRVSASDVVSAEETVGGNEKKVDL